MEEKYKVVELLPVPCGLEYPDGLVVVDGDAGVAVDRENFVILAKASDGRWSTRGNAADEDTLIVVFVRG